MKMEAVTLVREIRGGFYYLIPKVDMKLFSKDLAQDLSGA